MLPLNDLPEFAHDFSALRDSYLADEALVMSAIFAQASLTQAQREQVQGLATRLIESARHSHHPLFSEFLQQYRLDSQEGRILLTLAEALLRIPDAQSRNELINSLLPQANWQISAHKQSAAMAWASKALNQAKKFIEAENAPDKWHQLLLKMGDGMLRPALTTGIHLLAKQFVMAETIPTALAQRQSQFLYSFDCLGEAAQTMDEAQHYLRSYQQALEHLSNHEHGDDIFNRDSISIKLSALHPRYEARHWAQLQQELIPKLIHLIRFAAEANIPVTFDAEESERLELSLAIFAEVFCHEDFKDYHGLGLAVQAYQKRAPAVISWLQRLAQKQGKKIPIRLVKGAYWDSEIKRAQQLGLSDYPVFTRKLHTDVCYLSCAYLLLKHPDQFWPQFATHNAHTLAWLETVATDLNQRYEIQRLVGMGEAVHDSFHRQCPRPTRLYAPIGEFNTLLPYLVRRLLENGSSQSFVNQLANPHINSENLCQDPVLALTAQQIAPHPKLAKPKDLFLPRENSQGFSWADIPKLSQLRESLIKFQHHTWEAGITQNTDEQIVSTVHSPVDKHRLLGTIYYHHLPDIEILFTQAQQRFDAWQQTPVHQRAGYLRALTVLIEEAQAEILYLLTMEAGKTLPDALGEWREAIDLCRFYAQEAEKLQTSHELPHITGEHNHLSWAARGVFVCISPWNFPLAIFLGQIAAAIVTGNTVIAKPANQTSLIASKIAQLLQQTGLPEGVVNIIFARSSELGDYLFKHPHLAGVVFTGSTETAQHIQLALAQRRGAIIPFIAETGGLNAMIADSSALAEQLVYDVMQSAFNSAGQRCSALRVLWLQEEIADTVLKRLAGQLALWQVGHSQHINSDMSAVIDGHSQQHLLYYCQQIQQDASWSAHATLSIDSNKGHYLAPHAFVVSAANLPKHEIFGPILHICLWQQGKLAEVIEHINRDGYGLTLAIHSRIQSHIDYVQRHARVGNIYINRNQIGAQVACQPFGGEGLSGTGFKAGGRHYLLRFCTERVVSDNITAIGANTELVNLDV